MKFIAVLSILIFLKIDVVLGQDTLNQKYLNNQEENYGLHLQLNGFQKALFELGFSKYNTQYFRCGFPPSSGWNIGTGVNIDFNKTIIYPKIGVWASNILSFGLSVLYVSNIDAFSNGGLRIRPEIGFGLYNVRFISQFNIPLYHYEQTKNYIPIFNLGFMVDLSLKKTSSLYGPKTFGNFAFI